MYRRMMVAQLLVILLVVVMAGCNVATDLTPEDEGGTTGPPISTIDDGDDEPVEEPADRGQFTVDVSGYWISLRDWDADIELEEILGEPVALEVQQLGSGADTFAGCYVKEVTYEGSCHRRMMIVSFGLRRSLLLMTGMLLPMGCGWVMM